jgi:hypothetical protein
MAAVCNTTWCMMVQCTRYCLWSGARAEEGAGGFHWVNARHCLSSIVVIQEFLLY